MLSFINLLFCSLSILATAASALSSNSTILVIARTEFEAKTISSGFRGYGIPYEVLIVPKTGAVLPQLVASDNTSGRYGGFLLLGEVSYDFTTHWGSALNSEQFTQIYAYQNQFGVRLVRLDVYPQPEFGVTTQIASTGCCGADEEQLVSISDDSKFKSAGLKVGAGITTQGLYHYPAVITDSSNTVEVAQFGASSKGSFPNKSTAAVIHTVGKRQQMVWFISWGTDWSPTSAFLQHAYMHWLTRGLYLGRRRILLNTQIDDVGLATNLYYPANTTYRCLPEDLDAHVEWTASINLRMPAGSDYFIELGHNGNGNLISAVTSSTTNQTVCDPNTAIYFDSGPVVPLEWLKPVGSGSNAWPLSPADYSWSDACSRLDPLTNWFRPRSNLDAFSHVSHTFAHLNLNNATYSDVGREIQFNQAWFKETGIAGAKHFSSNGLIPPQISGVRNGDAIKAWLDNGITNVVGDNTRAGLLNTENEFWPLMSSVDRNGYPGLAIIPRWATTIYYNCDLAECTTREWIDTSGGAGEFSDLLTNAVQINTRNLLGLHQDPYMFHQANLRVVDVEPSTVGDQTGKMSLLMVWTEAVVQELVRLTSWPIVTLKHDDMAKAFTDRMALDKCRPTISWTYGNNGTTITGVTIGTARENKCNVPVPVTFPGTASTTIAGVKHEQRGSDPLTIWTTMTGCPVTYILDEPVKLDV